MKALPVMDLTFHFSFVIDIHDGTRFLSCMFRMANRVCHPLRANGRYGPVETWYYKHMDVKKLQVRIQTGMLFREATQN